MYKLEFLLTIRSIIWLSAFHLDKELSNNIIYNYFSAIIEYANNGTCVVIS